VRAKSRGVYAAAGVDIGAGAKAKELIAKLAESTHLPGVLSRLADLFL